MNRHVATHVRDIYTQHRPLLARGTSLHTCTNPYTHAPPLHAHTTLTRATPANTRTTPYTHAQQPNTHMSHALHTLAPLLNASQHQYTHGLRPSTHAPCPMRTRHIPTRMCHGLHARSATLPRPCAHEPRKHASCLYTDMSCLYTYASRPYTHIHTYPAPADNYYQMRWETRFTSMCVCLRCMAYTIY